MPRIPCPKCGAMSRLFNEYFQGSVKASGHLMATGLRGNQPFAFTESERPDLTRLASLEPDETIRLGLRGVAPRNEQDSYTVCETLVAALNAKGSNLTLLGRGQGDEDCVVKEQGVQVGIQVVRAITDPGFWTRLARSGEVSLLHLTAADAATALKAAIEHKVAPSESAKNWGLRCRFKLLHVVLHPGIPLLECLPEFIIEHTCAHL